MKDKLPLTEEMTSYIKADQMMKEGEEAKAHLRDVVISQLQQGEYKNVGYAQRKSIVINENKFFDWVKNTWPNKLNELKIDKIDPAKFDRAYTLGEIDYEE